MKSFGMVACTALALLAWEGTALAQSASELVFATVDSVVADTCKMQVSGILEGEQSPKEVTFDFGCSSSSYVVEQMAACQRMALAAMNKPGQYRLDVQTDAQYPRCRLTRVNP